MLWAILEHDLEENKRCWHDFPLGHKPNLNVAEIEKKGKITKYGKKNMKETGILNLTIIAQVKFRSYSTPSLTHRLPSAKL